MPFNQALFWFGLTAFATGLYYLWDSTVKRLHSIGLTVLGTLACAYTVYRDSHPEFPAIHLWVILLVLTWAFLGYGIYLGRFRRLPLSTEKSKDPTLAERIFELATRYKKAAREFHKKNPQPPADPALAAWKTKAAGWQKVNFYTELQRAKNELAAEGLGNSALLAAVDATPTFGQIEHTTQLLRFLASQLSDDPSDYQNVRLPEIGSSVLTSITHFVSVNIISLKVDEKTISCGKTLKIRYEVFSSEDLSDDIWLGASLLYKNGKSFWKVSQDKPVSLLKGTREYDRDLTIPTDAPLGNHMLMANVWHGPLSDGHKSTRLTNGGRVEIVVVA